MRHTRYPHVVIIGRIPEEENHSHSFENVTIKEALRSFPKELWSHYRAAEKKWIEKRHGATHYVERILTSNSPITDRTHES